MEGADSLVQVQIFDLAEIGLLGAALLGAVVLMLGMGSSAWAMVGLSFGVGSNLAAIELNVISLKLNLVALGVVVW